MKEERKTWNAKIKSASLDMGDHGCLTFWIGLDGGSIGCNFGGYCIGKGYVGAKEFEGSSDGLEAIMRIMDTVEVDRWEDLVGKYVRVVYEGLGASVKCIGNLTKDKWFNIEEFFKKKKEEEPKKPMPKDVNELHDFVLAGLKEKYDLVSAQSFSTDIIVHVEEYNNGRNDVWIQFPYFHSR